ncbi:MAG: hypothetical protein COT74_10140 [Bdellovibrionales bacterium CG10_big_fil_rev_8_21_14_0_10_45_34]|nr:MAG: hypothetical protein COT74_10140 [Bdellovibrionales bacterium CG10_big_fil_rev_8_21_14_0_10_45_34]
MREKKETLILISLAALTAFIWLGLTLKPSSESAVGNNKIQDDLIEEQNREIRPELVGIKRKKDNFGFQRFAINPRLKAQSSAKAAVAKVSDKKIVKKKPAKKKSAQKKNPGFNRIAYRPQQKVERHPEDAHKQEFPFVGLQPSSDQLDNENDESIKTPASVEELVGEYFQNFSNESLERFFQDYAGKKISSELFFATLDWLFKNSSESFQSSIVIATRNLAETDALTSLIKWHISPQAGERIKYALSVAISSYATLERFDIISGLFSQPASDFNTRYLIEGSLLVQNIIRNSFGAAQRPPSEDETNGRNLSSTFNQENLNLINEFESQNRNPVTIGRGSSRTPGTAMVNESQLFARFLNLLPALQSALAVANSQVHGYLSQTINMIEQLG